MHWILQFLFRHRTLSSFILTVALSLWMISLPASGKQRIAQGLLVSVFYPFQYAVSLSTNIKNIFAENKQLRKEVAQLRTRIALAEEAYSENQRLRQLLSFGQSIPYNVVAARVVSMEPSHLLRGVAINVGTADGVTELMPLISKDGVAGKIIQALGHVSRVQLIKDPSCRTSVMVKRSRVVGIMQTDNSDEYYFRCRSHADVQSGDTIITSGLGGVFPKGLLVGAIDKVDKDPDILFKRAYIRPYVDFDHIEEVFVVKMAPQWSAFCTATDSLALGKP